MELEVRHDMVDVTPQSDPDLAWEYVDRRGHAHRWRLDNPGAPHWELRYSLPSLRFVLDDPSDQDSDYAGMGHFECAECGERIEPRRVRVEVRRYMPGLGEYYIDGEAVSQEEYDRALASLG